MPRERLFQDDGLNPRRLFGRFIVLLGCLLIGSLFASLGWGADGQAAIHSAGTDRGTSTLFFIFLFLLILSGLSSGSETAIFSLNKLDVVQIRKSSSRSTRALIYLLDHPNDTLITILVLNNFVNVGLSLSAGALTEAYFSGLTPLSFSLAAFGATALILVFGEVLPKCVAHVKALNVARVVAWPTAGLTILMAPIRFALNALIRATFTALGISEPKTTEQITEEELEAVLRTGQVSTLLEEDELDMIEGVFELRHTFAEDIMVPRPDVSSFPNSLSQEEMLSRLRQAPHSRVIIYDDTFDHPVGFLLIKEVLLNPERDWRTFIREPLMVPVKIRLLDLLKRFRHSPAKIALLVDEYGGVAGIVTLHDLLEEIVGDITERHETVVAECQMIAPGHWRVRGQMNLADLAGKLGVTFPEDMGTTVGGFVMNMLGRVPTVGSELEHDGLRMKVTRMAGRRIVQLDVIQPLPEPAEAGTETRGAV